MSVILELRTPSMEWVFLENVHEATRDEIASYLKRMKSIYPENIIRALDTLSGKIIDLI